MATKTRRWYRRQSRRCSNNGRAHNGNTSEGDEGDLVINQSHFTLSFPLKAPADAKALAEQLPTMMPGLFQAADTIGTVHYSRFTVLSDKALLFLVDFDW